MNTNTNTVIIENNNNNTKRDVIKVNRLLSYYSSFPPFDISPIIKIKPKKKLTEFGYIQILKSKKIRIFFQEDNTGIQIQNNGLTVCLCGEKNNVTCSVSQIPNNWNNKMVFCYKVINCLKSFIPQVYVNGGKYLCKLMSNTPVPDFVYITLNYRFYYYMNKRYVRINDVPNNKQYYHSFCPDKNGYYVIDKRNCSNEFCYCNMKKEDNDDDVDSEEKYQIEVSKHVNPIPYEFNGYIVDGFKNYQFCLEMKEKYGKNVDDTVRINLNHKTV